MATAVLTPNYIIWSMSVPAEMNFFQEAIAKAEALGLEQVRDGHSAVIAVRVPGPV